MPTNFARSRARGVVGVRVIRATPSAEYGSVTHNLPGGPAATFSILPSSFVLRRPQPLMAPTSNPRAM